MSFWWDGEEDSPQRTRRAQRKKGKKARRKRFAAETTAFGG
jgi:hypothetical protein